MEIELRDLRPSYDLIVIGSGPAGLTLAHKYEERTGNSVLHLNAELVRSGLGRMGIRPEKFNVRGGGT